MAVSEIAGDVAPPSRPPLLIIFAAWLVPGAGHYLLGRRGRGLIIFAAVLVSFVVGALMNGPFFSISGNGGGGDLLARFIQIAGAVGNYASGIFYIVAAIAGYNPPDQPGHAADYGSKFLVAAGVMNILAIVDAWEIAKRIKD